MARDGGEVPQETSAFITVRLTVSNDLRPPSVIPTTSTELSKLEIIYFKGEELSEFFPINQPFGYLAGINGFNLDEIDRIELIQGNEIFKIIKEDKYKLAIKKKLDFEVQSVYHLKLRYVTTRVYFKLFKFCMI